MKSLMIRWEWLTCSKCVRTVRTYILLVANTERDTEQSILTLARPFARSVRDIKGQIVNVHALKQT